MSGTFYNNDYYTDNNQINFFSYNNTFKALVDAIIPRTPGLAVEFGKIQFFGATDSYVDEFLRYSLDYYAQPLANPAAIMLNIAAEQLVNDDFRLSGDEPFASLSQMNRLRTLELLDQNQLDLENFPIPYQDNPRAVISTVNNINRLTMMGYYSEWSGYGSTRLDSPNKRVLEFVPIS
jgi:hypothetical protein